MITEMKGASNWLPLHDAKVLVVKDGYVVRTHNHSDTGSVIPIVASLLLDESTTGFYLAGISLFESLADLNTQMQHCVPGWRMRMTNRRRHAFTKDGRKRVTGRFFVDYFSVDARGKTHRSPRRKCDVINLDLLTEKPPNHPDEQLEMALAILEMCENRGIRYKHTRGGLGSAMLRVSPFWEKGRTAAPRFINEQARQTLPGNFYSLSQKHRNKSGIAPIPHCYYVDQTSAHHRIVREVALPHPQGIHARGNIRTMKGVWCLPDSEPGRRLLSGTLVGLTLCKVHVSSVAPTQEHLYPPWALKRGSRNEWLWTPEFRLFKDHRIQLVHFVASFSASTSDLALREYANWAVDELGRNEGRARYKKGSLLAAYGMLAFNSCGRNIYRYWGGHSTKPICEIPRAGLVSESKISVPEHVQLSTVNVIARGLIEAETRTRSIEYARELHAQGLHIPQIYADGLLVETDHLPFVKQGWRVSHSLTNVHLPRANAIISDQVVKLPGVAGASEADLLLLRRHDESLRILQPEQRREIDLVTA
jgi:hypothetical protein